MSTIATQLNWGASYIVNDFYRRFIREHASERHYVHVSQWTTVLLTVISAIVTFYMDSIAGAWKWLLVIGAGTGPVLMIRWYWWRITAISEISAMIFAFITSVVLQVGFGLDSDKPLDFAWIMIITVTVTTAGWLIVTLLTPPEPDGVLTAFYRRTRPSLTGWSRIAALVPDVRPSQDGWRNALDWICGCVLIYCALFGSGKIILGDTLLGCCLLAAAILAGGMIYWDLQSRGWSSVVD